MLSVFDEDVARMLHENSIRKEAWIEGWIEGWNKVRIEGLDEDYIKIWKEVWNVGRKQAWNEGRKKGRKEGITETIAMLLDMGVDESILSKVIANFEAQAQKADA